MTPGEWSSVPRCGIEERHRRRDDGQRFGHAAGARLRFGLARVPIQVRSPQFLSDRNISRLRRVAGCAHMAGFIAGAISTGRRVARRTVVGQIIGEPMGQAAPSDWPWPARQRRNRASRARADVTDRGLVLKNRTGISIGLVAGERRSGELEVTNCCAPWAVITHRTCAPLSRRRRIRSERLVGGDAACDDQKDPFSLGQSGTHHSPPHLRAGAGFAPCIAHSNEDGSVTETGFFAQPRRPGPAAGSPIQKIIDSAREDWCPWPESNGHSFAELDFEVERVYQFRHRGNAAIA